MMVGQKVLLNKLHNISLDNFPKSLILFGESGCGKHTYCNLISDQLCLELLDITNNISLEYINEIYFKVNPYIYLIDSSKISIKEQNMLLKLIEEPLKNSYIIILCRNKHSLIPTIINRCHIWSFETYSQEELNSFGIEDPYKIANTPGQLLNLKGTNIDPIIRLADNIIDKMCNASISNALSISNKIAFKDEKDKINLYWFNKILLSKFTDRLKMYSNPTIFNMYKLVIKYLNDIETPKIDAKILLDNLIINLWEVAHNGIATT